MAKLFVIRHRDVEKMRLAESIEGASVLLLQDGVYLSESARVRAYASAADAAKRGAKLGKTQPVNYPEMVALLLEQGHTVVNL